MGLIKPFWLFVLASVGIGHAALAFSEPTTHAAAPSHSRAQPFSFPTVRMEDEKARALMENALAYISPLSNTVDPDSGYIFEGWNHDPDGMNLHNFTQLTAIGEWIELLAEIVVGNADSPYMSRPEALAKLQKAIDSLLRDQKDPKISRRGLLQDFIHIEGEKRSAFPPAKLFKRNLLAKFGQEEGQKIWAALEKNGWIHPEKGGQVASIERTAKFHDRIFDGALAAFDREPTKGRLMALMTDPSPKIVYGDNANLSNSVGKAIGALLSESVKDQPEIQGLIKKMDGFLDAQQDGYRSLYDPKMQLFYFGYEGEEENRIGWGGNVGHHDYLMNEFRNPSQFLVTRFGLPKQAVENLGFQIKPYVKGDGRADYVMASFDGSVFEAIGLASPSMPDLKDPSWNKLLKNFVRAESDFCNDKGVQGYLSESYRHMGQYTASNGIPALAATDAPRYTDASSLYTLGTAYGIDPANVEKFLERNWSDLSPLMTNHGPWEGYNNTQKGPIEVQTSAHTLSIPLGMINTGAENMARYMKSKGLEEKVREFYRKGENIDWLASGKLAHVPADEMWTRDEKTGGYAIRDKLSGVLELTAPRKLSVSGGELTLTYRSGQPVKRAEITLVSANKLASEIQEKKILLHFPPTGSNEWAKIKIPLPATLGLTEVQGLKFKALAGEKPLHIEIEGLSIDQGDPEPPSSRP